MTLDLDAIAENAELLRAKGHAHVRIKADELIELVELARQAESAEAKQ